MHPPMYVASAYRNFNDGDATLPVRPLSSQSCVGVSRRLKRSFDLDETIIAPLKRYRSFEPTSSLEANNQPEDESQPPPPIPKDFGVEELVEEDSQPPPLPCKDYIAPETEVDDLMDSQPPPLPTRDFEPSIIVVEDSQYTQPPPPLRPDYKQEVDEPSQDSQPPPTPPRDYEQNRGIRNHVDSPPPPARDYMNHGSLEIVNNSSYLSEPAHVDPAPTGRTLYAVCSQGFESYRIEDSTAQMHTVNHASQSSMISAVSLDSLATQNYLIPPRREPVTRKSLPTSLTQGVRINNLPPWPMYTDELKRATSTSNGKIRPIISTNSVTPSRGLSQAAHQPNAAPPAPVAADYSVTDSWNVTAVFEAPNNAPVFTENPVSLSMGELSALSFLCNSEVNQTNPQQPVQEEAITAPLISEQPEILDVNEAPAPPPAYYVQKEQPVVVLQNVKHEILNADRISENVFHHSEREVEDHDAAPAPPATDYVHMDPTEVDLHRIKQEILDREPTSEEVHHHSERDVEDLVEAPTPIVADYITNKVQPIINNNLVKTEPQETLGTQQRNDLSFICTGLSQTEKEQPVIDSQQRNDLSFICEGLSLTMEERPDTLCTQQRVDLSFLCEEDNVNAEVQSLSSVQSTQASDSRSPVKEELEEGNLVIDMEETLETEIPNNFVNESEEDEDFSLLNRDDEPIEIVRSQEIDDRQRSMLQFSSCLDHESTPLVRNESDIIVETDIQETLVVGVNFHPSYDNFNETVISAVHAAFF